MDQEEVSSIEVRMRQEWDRRVAHNYRYWMSDGTTSDELMWQTGNRDLNALLSDLPENFCKSSIALDLGCGVGRLLRGAASRFKSVVGVDVSAEAIDTARRLLADLPNIHLQLGSGDRCDGIEDASIDLAYSFASIGSLPGKILAGYLRDLARVVRPDGLVRLQLFLGAEHLLCTEDTLGIRSYDRDRFQKACEAAGFDLSSLRELEMVFEVSDQDAGMIAQIVSLTRSKRTPASTDEIYGQLLANSETQAGKSWSGSATEYQMALTLADQQLKQGEMDLARETLEFAIQNYRDAEPQILRVLGKLRAAKWESEAAAKNELPLVQVEASSLSSAAVFEKNLNALKEKGFSCAAEVVAEPSSNVTLSSSASGEPILLYAGTPMDNVEKARRAAEVWVERTMAITRIRDSKELAVVGAATAYHLECLASQYAGAIHLVEPNIDVLRLLVRTRDISKLIKRLSSISTTFSEAHSLLGETLPEIVIHPQTQLVSREFIDELKGKFYSKRGRKELRPNIGLVGPLYGGTLPITHATARALYGMKQRFRCFDMSSFYKNFYELEGYVRDKNRKDTLQNQYVEMLSQIVLESVIERPIDILLCLAQAPLSPRVLTELRNRGVITAMWFVEDGRRFTSWQRTAPFFDYMFVIQKDGFPKLVESAGAGRAVYVPTACEPLFQRPMKPEDIDDPARWGSTLSFVGAGYNNRQQMFASLANRDLKIWGTEWSNLPPFDRLVQEGGRRIAPEEYIKIFNSSTINLNLHSSSERDGVEPNGDFVNPRTFELAACEAFQLVDNRKLLPEMFEVGKELVTFDDLHELEQKIDYYLAHPDERKAIASAARARVLSEHTYEHRIETMLGYIYADRYEQLQSRAESSPWTRTLNSAKEYPELQSRLQTLYEHGEDPKIQGLIADIQTQTGKLSETDLKLLFLWHVKQSVATMNELRAGRV